MRSADPPLAGAATAASRCGPAHGQNEDRWVLLGADDLLLLAVADGMGGTAGGGIAAGLALQPLLELAAPDPGPAAGNAAGAAGRTGPAAGPIGQAGGATRVECDEPADPDSTLEPPPADPISSADAPGAETPAAADPVGGPGPDLVDPAAESPPALGGACMAVQAAMLRAHERVRAAAAPALPSALRPGSTLTVALVLGDRLTVGHVGDSGCWLLRRGTLIRLTEVHTHAAVLVAAGAVDRDSPAARRLDNLLTRHLGMPGELRPQLVTARLRSGDRLLLASDGLYRTLPMPELAALVARPDTTADQLVDAAVAAGARDDVTALLATVGEPVSGYAAPVGTVAGGPAEPAPAGVAGRADLAAPDERPAASRPEVPRAAAGR
ncbi:MAG TPA: protein phosphatase 2C domain-containing protein [Mycobacteriales bacterium]|nr:protein phosphatase 2C domain-containing protein [Mycobacteriales bacterium]